MAEGRILGEERGLIARQVGQRADDEGGHRRPGGGQEAVLEGPHGGATGGEISLASLLTFCGDKLGVVPDGAGAWLARCGNALASLRASPSAPIPAPSACASATICRGTSP